MNSLPMIYMKMHSGISIIHIRVITEGEEHLLTTYPGEYRSLMMLIYDRVYVDGFGECRGMGRCGTCRVTIDGDPSSLTGMDRNEEATLAKAGYVPDEMRVPGHAHIPGEDVPGEVRLSCQILLDEHLDGRTVTVLNAG